MEMCGDCMRDSHNGAAAERVLICGHAECSEQPRKPIHSYQTI